MRTGRWSVRRRHERSSVDAAPQPLSVAMHDARVEERNFCTNDHRDPLNRGDAPRAQATNYQEVSRGSSMALVPLEVLLDRLIDDCPVCGGSAEPGWICADHPGRPWRHDGCGADRIECVCDPFEARNGPESFEARRELLVTAVLQGPRLH